MRPKTPASLIPSLTLALALIGANGLSSPAGWAMDLSQAVVQARAQDPTLEAARHALAAGHESAKQATALYLPQISATATGSYVHSRTSSTLQTTLPLSNLAGNASGYLHGFSVTLTQPIYNAAVRTSASQLKDQSRLADIQYLGAWQNLILQVAQSYFGVLMAQDNLELAREQRAAIAQQLASAQARFDAGKANITEVRDAQARDQAMAAQEIVMANNLQVQQQQFQSLVGVFPADLAGVPDDFKPTAPMPDQVQPWIERGRAGNPNVLGAQTQISIAAANVDKNRPYNRPQLNLYASYQDTRQNGGLPLLVAPDHAQQTVVGLQLNIPLFAGGAYSSQLRQAIDQKREADAQLRASLQSSDIQVREQYLTIQSTRSEIAALQKAVVAAKSSLDATVLGLEVGVRTTLDVLNAQQQYFSTLQSLSAARYQYLLSRLNLVALVGALGEPDVEEINRYLAQGVTH